MASLPESVFKTKTWTSWAGSQADLGRILRLVEKQYVPLVDEHVGRSTAQSREIRAFASSWKAALRGGADLPDLAAVLGDLETKLREQEDAEREAFTAGRIKLATITRNDERRTVVGTAYELEHYIDARELQEAEFRAPSGDIRGYDIRFFADRNSGISLQVVSGNSQWCRAAFAELSDEISKQVPWWRTFRNSFCLYLFYTGFLSVPFCLLANGAASRVAAANNLGLEFLMLAAGGVGLLSGGFAVGGIILTRKLIPAFEIVELGKSPMGKRFLAAVGSIAGALVIGLAVDIISRMLRNV